MGEGADKRSIAERRGFGSNAAARINTTSPLAFPTAPSPCPCVTIPPGISPTALLDSPIMLPNSQAMPSPTTGTFLPPPLTHQGSLLDAASGLASSSAFEPQISSNPLPPFSVSEIQVSNHCIIAKGGISDCRPLVPDQAPMDFSIPVELPKGHKMKSEVRSFDDVKVIQDAIYKANSLEMQMHCSEEVADKSFLPKKVNKDIGQHNLIEEDKRETSYLMGVARTSEDGYNWRKYGQKQVKGSDYPRSYYKCTHPNCLVKKKVERSLDGQITEIIYKGTHNHGKPQPSRRPSLGSALSTDEVLDGEEGGGKAYAGWRNIHSGMKDIEQNLDWKKTDDQERASPTSIVTELSDIVTASKDKPITMFESEDTPELCSTLASQDDEEDGTTRGSISLEEGADDEEPESKRKKESCLIEPNFASRAVREPRVVVQIESEVDILDDGYRWRKYGQKVVKGNPNPRSYYKCTSAGCVVRKQVERASHDLKFVFTSYEGKHNHEVPNARSNNALALPGNVRIPKPEAQIHFDRKPEFIIGGFGDAINFRSYGTYETPQPVFPDYAMSPPLNLPSSADCVPIHSFKELHARFLMPTKQEPHHDAPLMYDSSTSTSLYHRLLHNFHP